MQARTVLLIVALTASAITTATAQGFGAQATTPEPSGGLAAPLDSLVPDTTRGVETPVDVVGTVDHVTGLAEDGTGIALPVDALPLDALPLDGLTDPAHVEVGVEAPTAPIGDKRSLGEQAAAVAAPAAGSALVAVTLGFLAFGGEGLRLLQSRIAGSVVRALRGAVGLLAALPLLSLFSRIERGAVMDNAQRARVHEVIAQDPGLSLSQVSARAGIAWGTAVHHLRRLEQHGMVVSLRDMGHRRFFIANTPAAAQRAAVSVVMHPTARRIAEFVAHRPGTDQAGICQALGLNNPAASKHLSHFEQRGLVVAQRSGRSRHYHATGGLHSALLLLDPAPAMASPQAAARTLHPMVAG